jgi:hypothetical protein
VPPCVMCRQVTAATRLPLPSMEAHVMFLAGHDPIEIGGELADQAGMGAPRYLSDHGRNPPWRLACGGSESYWEGTYCTRRLEGR